MPTESHEQHTASRLRGGRLPNFWSTLLPILLGAACLIFLAGPMPANASPDPHSDLDTQDRTSVSRSGGSSSGGSQGRSSVSRGSGGGGRATATRPSGGSGGSGRTPVHRPPSTSRPPSGGHGGYYHGYYGYRGYYSHFPYFGFSYFRFPYYLGLAYSPYAYRYPGPVWYDYQASPAFGGLDLNIKPKKAEVYVDGQRIGKVGRFDGYPGVLWLEEGTYDLVVYHPEHQTLHQKVKVFAGVVIDVDERMVEGIAIPPEEIVPPPAEQTPAERSARAAPPDGPESGRVRGGEVDLSHQPARLYLTIEPQDASVYLDGRFLGTGGELADLRSGLMVNPGEHRLAVVRPSYDSEELTVDVAAGEDVELAVRLRPAGSR